ncbi:MAG: vitamin K epoxide reductase family protein [Candidatus Woesebacteria bacterium]|nr:vitamin K epoxide reductase family protein [Candidatus Woesebacteria bacterium]
MKEKFFGWVTILAVIGIGLALFLLWERYFKPSFQPCNINSTVNCDAVIWGEVSDTLGIPTPLIGLLGYLVILFAAFKRSARWILGMATFGLIFCLYIAYRELFQLHVVCPVCILCQLDMITVFILGTILVRKQKNGN